MASLPVNGHGRALPGSRNRRPMIHRYHAGWHRLASFIWVVAVALQPAWRSHKRPRLQRPDASSSPKASCRFAALFTEQTGPPFAQPGCVVSSPRCLLTSHSVVCILLSCRTSHEERLLTTRSTSTLSRFRAIDEGVCWRWTGQSECCLESSITS